MTTEGQRMLVRLKSIALEGYPLIDILTPHDPSLVEGDEWKAGAECIRLIDYCDARPHGWHSVEPFMLTAAEMDEVIDHYNRWRAQERPRL